MTLAEEDLTEEMPEDFLGPAGGLAERDLVAEVSRDPGERGRAGPGREAQVPLAHGVKEFLVGRVTDWPGVHSGKAILEGKPLKGLWFSRTQEYAARNRGEDFGRLKYATQEELVLSPLPCWSACTAEEYRKRVAGLVEEIEAEARAERESRGLEPLGVEAILKQRPHTRPNQTKKSPAPLFHVVAKEVRETFWLMYSSFVAAFREAAEKLRTGNLSARFPVGSFPPGLPFVRAHPALPP